MDRNSLTMANKIEEKQTATVSKSSFIMTAVSVSFVVVFLAIGYVYIIQKAWLSSPSPYSNAINKKGSDVVVQVPFNYEVARISERLITLQGERGLMRLANDPTKVQVFLGTPTDSSPTNLSALREGQKIMLKMIPGQSAWIYIVGQ